MEAAAMRRASQGGTLTMRTLRLCTRTMGLDWPLLRGVAGSRIGEAGEAHGEARPFPFAAFDVNRAVEQIHESLGHG